MWSTRAKGHTFSLQSVNFRRRLPQAIPESPLQFASLMSACDSAALDYRYRHVVSSSPICCKRLSSLERAQATHADEPCRLQAMLWHQRASTSRPPPCSRVGASLRRSAAALGLMRLCPRFPCGACRDGPSDRGCERVNDVAIRFVRHDSYSLDRPLARRPLNISETATRELGPPRPGRQRPAKR